MRFLVVSGVLIASSVVAHAQAPGDYYDDAGDSTTSAPGETAPHLVPPPPTSPPEPTYGHGQRWSIGFNFGAMSVAPKGWAAYSVPTDFNITELAFRYRPWDHLELQFLLGGGRQTMDDGSKGNLAMGNGELALRYRFSPHTAWNWWVEAGLGATIIAAHDSSQEERDAAKTGHAMLGIGLERRFHHFAFQTELRWITIGTDKPDQEQVVDTGGTMQGPPTKTPGGGSTTPPTNDPGFYTPSQTSKLEGGQFTLGVSYYF